MKRERYAVVSLFALAFLVLAAEPALAAQYDTPTERLINDLNLELLYVAVPITVLVEGILFYAVWRFRNNDDPKPTQENRRLEITWTVATAVILLFVGFASYGVMADVTTPLDAQPSGDEVEVDVVAEKWVWNFQYPDENVSTTNTMVVPANRTVHLNITSVDWIHSFHVPELALKQDARPGKNIPLEFTATQTGEYTLYCAEYCGAGHSRMLGTIEVVSQEEYQQWLDENRGGSGGGNGGGNGGNSSSANESSL